MKKTKLVLAICVALLMTKVASSQGWRGIVPLKSTRADVLKVMGEPHRADYTYELKDGTVRFMYNREKCEKGLPADWGNWNVAPNTVVNISVEVDIPLKRLKVKNLEQYKWYTDHAGATYYRLPKEGLEYSVQDRRVTSITYGPRDSDKDLMCDKNPPEIRY